MYLGVKNQEKILSKTKLNKYDCSVWDNTIYLHHSKVQERKIVVPA